MSVVLLLEGLKVSLGRFALVKKTERGNVFVEDEVTKVGYFKRRTQTNMTRAAIKPYFHRHQFLRRHVLSTTAH